MGSGPHSPERGWVKRRAYVLLVSLGRLFILGRLGDRCVQPTTSVAPVMDGRLSVACPPRSIAAQTSVSVVVGGQAQLVISSVNCSTCWTGVILDCLLDRSTSSIDMGPACRVD